MISKSRADTPQDTTVVPPRAIQTSQEVNLFLEVLPYVAPDTATAIKEALELLSSPNLGVDSKIGSGDWWGLTRRRLDLLEESGDWNQVWKECEELLHGVESKAKEKKNGTSGKKEETTVAKTDGTPTAETEETKGRGDDWRVWEGFVKSAGELYNQENKSHGTKALEVILSHRATATPGASRNADLALVKFASLFHDHHEGPEGTPTLLEACKEYFTKTGTKSCCFEDLQNYLEMLETSEKAEFLAFVAGHVADMDKDDEVLENCLKTLSYHALTAGFYQKSKIAKVAAEINHHKFIYLLTISPLSTTAPTTSPENKFDRDIIPKLNSFITSTLNIYSSALPLGSSLLPTDNQYGDDAALLTTMGLIRLHLLHTSTSGSPTTIPAQAPLYQAISILTTVIQKSKHNYQALLLLVRLYLLVGAVSFAVEVYPRLNIKQIQNDTLSHFLLTRISTLLPAEKKVEQLLSEAGRIYESSSSQTPNMLVLAFERGGYAQMMGFLEFSERVAGSVCRSMWEIERRRVERLRGGSGVVKMDDGETLEKVLKDDCVIWDNRDFGVVVSCETEYPPKTGPSEDGEEKKEKSEEGIVKKRFEELFRMGPPPGENWVKALAIVEKLVAYCKAVIAAGADSTPAVLEPVDGVDILAKIAADKEAAVEFTESEKVYLEVATHIVAATQAVIVKDAEKAKEALGKAKEWFVSNTPSPDSGENSNPDWYTLHTLHLRLDVVLLVNSYLVPCLASPTHKALQKALKASISELNAAVTAFKGAVVGNAKNTAKEIEEEEGSDREQELVDRVLEMEKGDVGRLLRDLRIFGGVEKVVEGVRRVRGAIAVAVKSGLGGK